VHASTPTTAPAAPLQLSHARLAALLTLVASVAAALTALVFAVSGSGSSTLAARPGLSREVQAAVDNVPLIPAVAARVPTRPANRSTCRRSCR